MLWSKKKIKLNPNALKRNNQSIDPYNNANVVSDWLSKLVKEFVTIPLTIASTILTQSKYLIISNLIVVFVHLTTYLYWLFTEKEKGSYRKILLSVLIALVSIVLFYMVLNYYVPHIIIANQFLRILFKLNIWASATNLFLTCRSFILALWFIVVSYIITPVITWFDQKRSTKKSLKSLYKDIFFFRKKITDDEALSLGQRYVLEEFIINFHKAPIQKRKEDELKDAAQKLNEVLRFLVKRVNKKYYSLFGFIVNQREIDNLKSMIDKLLRSGDIKDAIDFVQKRIHYKLTQITQIEEFLSVLDYVKRSDGSEMKVEPRLSEAGSTDTVTDSCASSSSCSSSNSETGVDADPVTPSTPRYHRTASSSSVTTASDSVRLHAGILFAFNLSKEQFESNVDNCQAEIRRQLEKEKAVHERERDRLKQLFPDRVELNKISSP